MLHAQHRMLRLQIVVALVGSVPVENQDQHHPFLHGWETRSKEVVEDPLDVQFPLRSFLGVIAKER